MGYGHKTTYLQRAHRRCAFHVLVNKQSERENVVLNSANLSRYSDTCSELYCHQMCVDVTL